MGYKRWLPSDYKSRLNARSFDNKQELGDVLVVSNSDEILRQIQGLVSVHKDAGRGQKKKTVQQDHRANEEVVWKKKIFYSHCLIGNIICCDTTLMRCT
jgi:hypothetical protein